MSGKYDRNALVSCYRSLIQGWFEVLFVERTHVKSAYKSLHPHHQDAVWFSAFSTKRNFSLKSTQCIGNNQEIFICTSNWFALISLPCIVASLNSFLWYYPRDNNLMPFFSFDLYANRRVYGKLWLMLKRFPLKSSAKWNKFRFVLIVLKQIKPAPNLVNKRWYNHSCVTVPIIHHSLCIVSGHKLVLSFIRKYIWQISEIKPRFQIYIADTHMPRSQCQLSFTRYEYIDTVKCE